MFIGFEAYLTDENDRFRAKKDSSICSLGIGLLIGPAVLFDLQLLGFSKKLPPAGVLNFLLPWSKRGLILVIPLGVLLFITKAGALGVR